MFHKAVPTQCETNPVNLTLSYCMWGVSFTFDFLHDRSNWYSLTFSNIDSLLIMIMQKEGKEGIKERSNRGKKERMVGSTEEREGILS